jgi:hypothetical protein
MTQPDRMSCSRFYWCKEWRWRICFGRSLAGFKDRGQRSDVLFPVRSVGREVIAEFQLDVADRPIDVVWCTAFRPAVVMECGKQCLRMQSVLQNAGRERSGDLGLLQAAGRRRSARVRRSSI